jgi:hypothetical protein
VQAELQARRDRDRDRVPFTGVQVEALAEQIADVLYDRLAYVGECWIGLPPHSESDRPEPTARLDWRTEVRCTAATSSRSWAAMLPADIEGERRQLLAGVVVTSATFRALLGGDRR